MTEERQLWDRFPKEGYKAYKAFCTYLDLGPERSIENVRKAIGKYASRRWLQRWCSQFEWVKRAQAYDDYIERKKREEKEKAILEMAERHARLAVAFQQRVAERLKTIDPSELSPADLARWLEVAVKLERISRGEPGEINRQEFTPAPILEVVLPADENPEEAAQWTGEGVEE